MWFFINLKKIAISELDALGTLTTLEKILLGRKCGVPSWILSGYSELVSKTETLNDEEVEAVDYQTTVRLFRIREARLKGTYYHAEAWVDEIKRVFANEVLSVADECPPLEG
jgi:hypothetical protein